MGATFVRSGPPGSARLATAAQLGEPTTGDMPFVSGHFAMANEWARVDSAAEGRFMERFAPGAFARTIRENRASIRILYDHGQDPFIGRRPIAPLDGIGEDARGAYYFGRLFDTVAARELAPLLAAGVLGSSFRFGVRKMDEEARPMRSAYNPERLPERTIIEADLVEIGPTPFPVYRGATAGSTTGAHPPRAKAMTDAQWRAWLADAAAGRLPDRDAEGRRRWLDSVLPLPRTR